MPRVAIDDQVSEQAFGQKKVSEVLNDLLSTLPPNRIVTRILLDGQQLATEAAKRRLEDQLEQIQALEIKTVDKEIWAHNGLDVAISCVERVQRSLIRAAELFRDGTKVQANQYFVHCVDGLDRFYEAITITRVALRLDFNTIEADGRKLSEVEMIFSTILGSIIGFQEQEDFLGLADKVEFELIPHLSTWSRVLRQLRLSQNSNA